MGELSDLSSRGLPRQARAGPATTIPLESPPSPHRALCHNCGPQALARRWNKHSASPRSRGDSLCAPHVSSELAAHSLRVKASSKNASHQTNHFNSKKPASKNILRNAKATFKRKSPKTLENTWRRQASISILFGYDKNSSLPLLKTGFFAQSLSLLKITTVTNH